MNGPARVIVDQPTRLPAASVPSGRSYTADKRRPCCRVHSRSAAGVREDMIVRQPHCLESRVLLGVTIVIAPAERFWIRLADQRARIASNNRDPTEATMKPIPSNQLNELCLTRHTLCRALRHRNRREASFAHQGATEWPARAPQRFGPFGDHRHIGHSDQLSGDRMLSVRVGSPQRQEIERHRRFPESDRSGRRAVWWRRSSALQVGGDFGELGQGGFEVFDDLSREDVGSGEVGAVFEALVF